MQILSPQLLAALLSIAIISAPSTSFADTSTKNPFNGCRYAEMESYKDNPLPPIQNPDLRECLLKYLIASQPRLRSSEATMPEDMPIDVTDEIIGPDIWPYCNAAPAQRHRIRALLNALILGEENYRKIMASIVAACNIRIFRTKTDDGIQFIAVYRYSQKSDEFIAEKKTFTTELEGYRLTVVQTLMKD